MALRITDLRSGNGKCSKNVVKGGRIIKAPRRREREVQSAILSLLRARGVPAWKVGSGGFHVGERYVRMGQKGMADIVGVLPWCISHDKLRDASVGGLKCVTTGRFLAIEVKAAGKLPTEEQAAFLHMVTEAGGLAFVAHSVDEVSQQIGWT